MGDQRNDVYDADALGPRDFMPFVGKVIAKIGVDKEDTRNFVIEMKDGTALALRTDEPDCCASHYMTCDDDLKHHVGAKLYDVVVKLVPKCVESEDMHEVMFFDIVTSKGYITCTSHNEHNGYYGGVGVNLVILRSIQSKGKFR